MISELLNESLEFFKIHFNYKEKVLEDVKYPDLESHKIYHKKIMEQFVSLKEKMRREKLKIVKDFFYFLKDYYVNHIVKYDKRYTPFINR